MPEVGENMAFRTPEFPGTGCPVKGAQGLKAGLQEIKEVELSCRYGGSGKEAPSRSSRYSHAIRYPPLSANTPTAPHPGMGLHLEMAKQTSRGEAGK